jgi:DNA modification methylase
MGSGTTAKMASLNKRNYIGSEVSKEYCEIAEKRINENI